MARFDAGDGNPDHPKGKGQWIELTHGKNGLDAGKGFPDQAHVLIHARLAASAVGATRIALNGTLGSSSAAPPPFRFRVAMGTVTYLCQNNQLVRYFTPAIPTTGLTLTGLGTIVGTWMISVGEDTPLAQAEQPGGTRKLSVAAAAGNSAIVEPPSVCM